MPIMVRIDAGFPADGERFAVSVLARVQQQTRERGADVLITKAVAQQLDARFGLESRGPASLRGISEPIELFALRGLSTGQSSANT
jgi:class 3 adenylate cyclase